jgi:hypothetical protein
MLILSVFRPGSEFRDYLLKSNVDSPTVTDINLTKVQLECLKVLSKENRVLPSLMAEQLQFGALPEHFDQTALQLIVLEEKKYFLLAVKLGMCFCYSKANEILDNPGIIEQMHQLHSGLVDFFQSLAVQFGEFYEPRSTDTLKNIFFDEDEFVLDIASIGASLIYGYLENSNNMDVLPIIEKKCSNSIHSIKQVRKVPRQIADDPTARIINRLLETA